MGEVKVYMGKCYTCDQLAFYIVDEDGTPTFLTPDNILRLLNDAEKISFVEAR